MGQMSLQRGFITIFNSRLLCYIYSPIFFMGFSVSENIYMDMCMCMHKTVPGIINNYVACCGLYI